jgi:hypothetical protein
MNAKGRESEKEGKALHDAGGFDGDADYLANQENEIVGIVFTVRVGVAFDLILIDDPFERGTRA